MLKRWRLFLVFVPQQLTVDAITTFHIYYLLKKSHSLLMWLRYSFVVMCPCLIQFTHEEMQINVNQLSIIPFGFGHNSFISQAVRSSWSIRVCRREFPSHIKKEFFQWHWRVILHSRTNSQLYKSFILCYYTASDFLFPVLFYKILAYNNVHTNMAKMDSETHSKSLQGKRFLTCCMLVTLYPSVNAHLIDEQYFVETFDIFRDSLYLTWKT